MKKRLLAAAVAGAVMLSAGAQAQDHGRPGGVSAAAGADHESSQPACAVGQ